MTTTAPEDGATGEGDGATAAGTAAAATTSSRTRLLVNVDIGEGELEGAVRFYSEGLGLAEGRRLGDDFVELLGGEAPIYLLVKRAGTPPFAGASAPRDYRRHWTPVHLDFVVEDIDAAVRRAVAAGAHLEEPVTEHAYGRLALLSDPFGHGFCLLQFTGRGYDEIATRSGARG